jgi:hypothetical protein
MTVVVQSVGTATPMEAGAQVIEVVVGSRFSAAYVNGADVNGIPEEPRKTS